MSIKDVVLFASGDLRLAANQNCWPAQADLEARLTKVFADYGVTVRRGHPVKTDVGHGFLASQREASASSKRRLGPRPRRRSCLRRYALAGPRASNRG